MTLTELNNFIKIAKILGMITEKTTVLELKSIKQF